MRRSETESQAMNYCFICARTSNDHFGMDHPFHTFADARLAYDAEIARRNDERLKAEARAAGKTARAYLRGSVEELVKAHFAAESSPYPPACDTEMQFSYLRDEVTEALETLEETFGA